MATQRHPEDDPLHKSEHVRGWVQNLPEEEPSLAWRSGLNERLLAEAGKQRKRRFRWVWMPATGLALAGSLALVVLFSPRMAPVSPSSAQSLEGALVQLHEQTDQSIEAGIGLSVPEVALDQTRGELPPDPSSLIDLDQL